MTSPAELANRAKEIIEDEIDNDDLAAIGYYEKDEVGAAYLREDIRESLSDEEVRQILDSARLESIGQISYETHHDETLTATIRAYEDVADMTIPTGHNEGLVLALDFYGSHSYQKVLEVLTDSLDDVEIGTDVSALTDSSDT